MPKLYFDTTDQVSPMAPVRWCITPEEREQILLLGIKKAFLLLTVFRDGQEALRKVVPLEQEMEYLQFDATGTHTVHCAIVGISDEETSQHTLLKRLLLRERYRGQYQLNFCDGENKVRLDTKWIRGGLASVAVSLKQYDFETYRVSAIAGESADIVVASGFFAKEPAKWEKWWVNLWFQYEPRDQCQFRKRRILAYTIQPPAVLVYAMFTGLFRSLWALFLVFIGMRSVKLSPIFHPFSSATKAVYDVSTHKHSNFFFTDAAGKRRSMVFLLVHPIVLALGGTGIYWLSRYELWDDLLRVALALGIVILGMAIVGGIGYLVVHRFGKSLSNRIEAGFGALADKAESWLKKRQENARVERFETAKRTVEAYTTLVCDGVPLKPSLQELPPERRTFHLRFMDFKARVCKPFAKA